MVGALHGWPHVSAQTARRVQAAKFELAVQEGQLLACGWRIFVDIVIDAPRQFSDEIRHAGRRVLPGFASAKISLF